MIAVLRETGTHTKMWRTGIIIILPKTGAYSSGTAVEPSASSDIRTK